MKIKVLLVSLVFLAMCSVNAYAENEERDVPSFSEIALKIPGTLHLKQGKIQHVKIVAKSSTLEEIITEVRDRKLHIRFPNKNLFQKNWNPGKIEIYITVPEVNGLVVSGSGDIVASDEIASRIIDLAVSGSGNINLEELKSERVKVAISGSGNISIDDGDKVSELSVSISGSGNLDAQGFEAQDVVVRMAGSGNCKVHSNGTIKARIAGSGNVYYKGNASLDSSVAGSGKLKKM